MEQHHLFPFWSITDELTNLLDNYKISPLQFLGYTRKLDIGLAVQL